MSWSTFELRVRLVSRETGLSPPVKYFYWPFQGSASFVDHLCYFRLVFVMLTCTSVYWCLVVDCLEKADLLAFLCLIVKLSLSHWYLGQLWCLIVLIPDLCPLSYFFILRHLIFLTLLLWTDRCHPGKILDLMRWLICSCVEKLSFQLWVTPDLTT